MCENIDQSPLACAPTGDRAETQPCGLTRNGTGSSLPRRTMPNQLNHAGQGSFTVLIFSEDRYIQEMTESPNHQIFHHGGVSNVLPHSCCRTTHMHIYTQQTNLQTQHTQHKHIDTTYTIHTYTCTHTHTQIHTETFHKTPACLSQHCG